jgi:hypothetical protein
MSDPSVHPTELHCTHCGRRVTPTRHTRTGYRVDYYSVHTGEVEPTAIHRSDDTTITVYRLLTAVDVITCVECYRRADVQAERNRLFRPEATRAAVAAAAPRCADPMRGRA